MAKKKPTAAQLKKMKVHYGMGVGGNIGWAANFKPKKKRIR